MIITIGGLAGTGTTTAAKVLSEKLDVPFVSAGSIFRDMAKERGIDFDKEFNSFKQTFGL